MNEIKGQSLSLKDCKNPRVSSSPSGVDVSSHNIDYLY